METQSKNMEEPDINSPKLESKERGKFASLNKQEAKLILETYIKRSLSNHETKRTTERREKRQVRIKRSVSDLTRFRRRAKENKIPVVTKAELLETKKTEVDNVSKPSESENPIQQNHQSANTASVKPAKKSWFRNLLDQLFKKEESPSEQTFHVASSVTPETDGQLTQTSKKASIKKNSLRRTLSLKKNVSEEETKPKRPTYLPLKRINKLSSTKQREKHEDCYYHQMSTEIELLVNDTNCTRKQSLGEESNDGETREIDDVIKQIVSILQRQGDAYDRKIKEDPTFSSFFRNISYNSFKQLADVYIDKEMKMRGSEDTPEDMKFAFSIHFTKQVAGIATHPVNRIMGFGNQYLQDTFTWLSHSTDNLNSAYLEGLISPD
ncbi:uncharacterized protein [Pyxicephalus adspersus]|uniref:uncharacterized protein isoform X2 n=1 Tax=Pyxicephalus adspersus TaxID=30357 RepID=UPI003B591E6B